MGENSRIFGYYLSWWNHSPHKWNKSRLEPRTEVLGRQVLWNGAEYGFKFALIKLLCDLALSQTSDVDGRRQWCSQFSVASWLHFSAEKIGPTISMLVVLYCTSYLSQSSCASLISPSLRWVRISSKLSELFRNSIQAIPLWMKERKYFRLHKKNTWQSNHIEKYELSRN